jgi:CrcB protein
MPSLLWICLAGAVGTGARYLLSTWLHRAAVPGFPWPTFAVNVVGSFLLGALMETAARSDLVTPALRVTLATGLLGGFTTYSSFNYETLHLFRDDRWTAAALYVALTVFGCLAAGALGITAAKLSL